MAFRKPRFDEERQIGDYSLKLAFFLIPFFLALEASAASLGRTSASFLNISVDPKNVALGELGVALKNGASALYLNPANLGEKNLRELALSYNDFFDDLNHQSLALGFGNSWGGWGFGLNRLAMAPIASFDANGASRGEIGVGSLALIAGFGRHLVQNLSLGLASKLIYEDLGTVDAKTVAFDLGASYIYRDLFFGAAISNVGPGLVFEKEKFPLPRAFRLGATYQIKNFRNQILASAEFQSTINQNARGAFGLEYGFRDLIFLRAGFKSGQHIGSGLRAGFGILIYRTELNYAWANFGDLGLIHRLGITFKFGQARTIGRSDSKPFSASLAFPVLIESQEPALDAFPENSKPLDQDSAVDTPFHSGLADFFVPSYRRKPVSSFPRNLDPGLCRGDDPCLAGRQATEESRLEPAGQSGLRKEKPRTPKSDGIKNLRPSPMKTSERIIPNLLAWLNLKRLLVMVSGFMIAAATFLFKNFS